MTYGQLLDVLNNLTEAELEFTVQVAVGDQYLVVHSVDPGDGDDPPVLDTNQ